MDPLGLAARSTGRPWVDRALGGRSPEEGLSWGAYEHIYNSGVSSSKARNDPRTRDVYDQWRSGRSSSRAGADARAYSDWSSGGRKLVREPAPPVDNSWVAPAATGGFPSQQEINDYILNYFLEQFQTALGDALHDPLQILKKIGKSVGVFGGSFSIEAGGGFGFSGGINIAGTEIEAGIKYDALRVRLNGTEQGLNVDVFAYFEYSLGIKIASQKNIGIFPTQIGEAFEMDYSTNKWTKVSNENLTLFEIGAYSAGGASIKADFQLNEFLRRIDEIW